MYEEKFGVRLAHFRKKKGLTQQHLADKINCALPTISRIETGREIPRLELFEKLNHEFTNIGIPYEDLVLGKVYHFNVAKDNLIEALYIGQLSDIKRCAKKFRKYMDPGNIEHRQYDDLVHIVYMKKKGLRIEDYIKKLRKTLRLSKNINRWEDLEDVFLTKIEFLIIYKMSAAYLEAGDNKEAERILSNLISNDLLRNTKYHYGRINTLELAKIFLLNNRCKEAEACITYSYRMIFESFNTRLLFYNLVIHTELFMARNNDEGTRLIDEFLAASQRLVNYIVNNRDIELS